MSQQADEITKKWVETWAKAGPRLEEIKRRELREMTYEQRIRAIDTLFQLGCLLRKPRTTSGLVEQQRLFRKARPLNVA